LPAVVGVWIFSYFVTAVMSARQIRPILAEPADEEAPASTIMREQLHFGMRAAGGSTAGFLNMRISIFIVSIVLSQSQLGLYTLAIGTGEMLWQVSRAFAWSALGRIGSDTLEDAADLVARITRNTLAIVGSLGIVAYAIGPIAIVLVYGHKFEAAGVALRWALPGLVAYAAEVALTKFIILQLRRPITIIGVQLGAAALCATITIVGAPQYGILAAAAATSITYLVVTAVLLTIFLRGTSVSARQLLLLQPADVQKYVRTFEGMMRSLRLRSA
jgi:O-antigen/teichoic acid export membrane protein